VTPVGIKINGGKHSAGDVKGAAKVRSVDAPQMQSSSHAAFVSAASG
jgi:hypothetical protein